MRKIASLLLAIILIAAGTFVQFSCKKKPDTSVDPIYMKTDLPRHELKHDLYYQLNLRDRSIELVFSEDLEDATVFGNIRFQDLSGDLTNYIDLYQSGNKVVMMFWPEFELKRGWVYEILLLPGLRSRSGLSMKDETIIECRTGTAHGVQSAPALINSSVSRDAIAIISDIHMGDQRAYNNDYCWFGKNQAALESFLDYVVSDTSEIRQVVILGDLFDEWLVPYTISPFDPAVNISSTRDFFNAVAGATVNENIFDRLKAVVNHDSVELIYVPGNHDMLGTEDILHEIIPDASWKGGPDGLGEYSPLPGMLFEHGHRYDFFNCPQPLVNAGHKLPPGYFVSRLYAKGMMDAASNDKSVEQVSGSFEFRAAWDIAFLYTLTHFHMDIPDVFDKNIRMGGINGYVENMSFHETKNMYAASIEEYWPATQEQNEVPVPMSCCLNAIWNGHSDLFTAAETQYMKQPPAPEAYKIIAFGHTHEAMLEVYPKGKSYSSIYANSGTWIDVDQCSYPVRTYLLITPKAWTGSKIDVVGLYQFNPDGQGAHKPHKLAEESID